MAAISEAELQKIEKLGKALYERVFTVAEALARVQRSGSGAGTSAVGAEGS